MFGVYTGFKSTEQTNIEYQLHGTMQSNGLLQHDQCYWDGKDRDGVQGHAF